MTGAVSAARLPRKVGEAAMPMEPVAAGTPLAEIVALLRDDPMRPGVLLDSPDGPRLLSRSSRTLHNPLVLAAGTAGRTAATASRRWSACSPRWRAGTPGCRAPIT
jgi:hypothetical protein